MNQDELIAKIRELLSRKYPDYVFKEIFQDEDVNFPDVIRIMIFFYDMENKRDLYVRLIVSIADILNAPSFLLTLTLIDKIDVELTKLKEDKT
jgi:hypothetical protein